MKKIIALLLALLMVLALFACKPADKESTTSPSDTGSTSPSETGDDGDASATAPHYDREPFTIVYLCRTLTFQWMQNIVTAMQSLREEYNYELIATDTGGDTAQYPILIETYGDQGVDGMIIAPNEDTAQRCWELCQEMGVPLLFESTAMRDDNGELLTSGTELDAYQVGESCAQWLADNYKNYWGDEDVGQSTLGFIGVTYSAIPNFTLRLNGVMETFKKNFADVPDNNYFVADIVSQAAMTAENAYNEVAPIIAAHGDRIEKWMLVGVVCEWGQGGARVFEEYNLTQDALICTAGGEALLVEWEGGNVSDCWVACSYYEAMDYVEWLIPGMIEHLETGIPIEDLWPEWREEGSSSLFASVKVPGVPATYDTYKELVKVDYAALQKAQ